MPDLENTIMLRVENYKGVEHLQVVLEPGVSILGGKNGAGKSSVLDAVANALGGKKLSPPQPVKDGADMYECTVGLEKLGIKITRTGKIGEDGKLRERLVIEDAEGFKSSSPQTLLDKLLNGNSIRPQAFAEISDTEKVEILKRAAGINWEELDESLEAAINARHDAGVRAAALEAQLNSLPEMADPGPREDPAKAHAELTRAIAHNADVEAKKAAAKDQRKTLEMLQVQLRQAKANVARVEKEIGRQEAARCEVPEPIDLGPLEDACEQVEEHNRLVESWHQALDTAGRLESEQRQRAKQQEIIANIRQSKKEQLARVELPVPGMSFDDDGVYLRGVPFEQASQSERLEASVRMELFLHPKVPIVLVHEGSLFDMGHLKVLDGVAREHGAFVFLERVMEHPEEGTKVFMVAGRGHNAESE